MLPNAPISIGDAPPTYSEVINSTNKSTHSVVNQSPLRNKFVDQNQDIDHQYQHNVQENTATGTAPFTISVVNENLDEFSTVSNFNPISSQHSTRTRDGGRVAPRLTAEKYSYDTQNIYHIKINGNLVAVFRQNNSSSHVALIECPPYHKFAETYLDPLMKQFQQPNGRTSEQEADVRRLKVTLLNPQKVIFFNIHTTNSRYRYDMVGHCGRSFVQFTEDAFCTFDPISSSLQKIIGLSAALQTKDMIHNREKWLGMNVIIAMSIFLVAILSSVIIIAIKQKW